MPTQTLEIFRGPYIREMLLLIQKGLAPATMADVIKLNLEGTLSFDKHYATSSATAYAGKNEDKFKLVLDSEELKATNRQTPLYHYGIRLDDRYVSIDAPEFTRKDMIIGRPMTQEEALAHQGWLVLAGNDEGLLGRYADSVFRQVKDRFGETEAMGFSLGEVQKVPILNAWNLCNLDSRFYAEGATCLDILYVQLVGVEQIKREV